MKQPAQIIEIFLQPGDFYFGDETTRIRTLLGSCVSITMWHPARRIGGMCHYMLPSRGAGKTRIPRLDGRYGDEAILMFFQEAIRHDTDPNDYVVKLFGGGNMFPQHILRSIDQSVSRRNVEAGRTLAKQYGFHVAAEALGGTGHRQVVFDVWSGHVWMRHAELQNCKC
jgi:chemotaxis protein CheD